jgi:methyltransferase (TIGR00027 family)
MNSDNGKIEGVSDTALWVAHFRALETQRPYPLFRDPLASTLVGTRGKKIAESMPMLKIMNWVMVLRTTAIDRLIQQALTEGVDAVVNLGAGMDTRPYRMTLPPDLRWVEIDFPHSVDYKNEKLKGQTPVCRLERIALDLGNVPLRQEIFKRIASESKKILVISEGLIPYLTNQAVISLSNDLHALPAFVFWVQDYNQGDFLKKVPKSMSQKMKMAPFLFFAADWFLFFKDLGWSVKSTITIAEEAERLRRRPPFIFPWTILMWFAPQKLKEERGKMSGYTLLERR